MSSCSHSRWPDCSPARPGGCGLRLLADGATPRPSRTTAIRTRRAPTGAGRRRSPRAPTRCWGLPADLLADGDLRAGIGAVLVANTAAMSLGVTRRELAVLGALGGRPRTVVGTTVTEMVVLGAIGGLLGSLGGSWWPPDRREPLEVHGVDRRCSADNPPTSRPATSSPVSSSGWHSVGGGGVLPARRAKRLDVAAELSGREAAITPSPFARSPGCSSGRLSPSLAWREPGPLPPRWPRAMAGSARHARLPRGARRHAVLSAALAPSSSGAWRAPPPSRALPRCGSAWRRPDGTPTHRDSWPWPWLRPSARRSCRGDECVCSRHDRGLGSPANGAGVDIATVPQGEGYARRSRPNWSAGSPRSRASPRWTRASSWVAGRGHELVLAQPSPTTDSPRGWWMAWRTLSPRRW